MNIGNYIYLGWAAAIIMASYAIYKIFDLVQYLKKSKIIGLQFQDLTLTNRKLIMTQMETISRSHSDFELLMLADKYGWPDIVITCLPKLYFKKDNGKVQAYVWSELIPLIPPHCEYSIKAEYCRKQILKISIPVQSFKVINEIAIDLENVRLHNPFSSYSSLMGVIGQLIMDYELKAKANNQIELAEAMKLE